MANVSKLKTRSTLGSPPSADDAGDNLSTPEIAPAAPPVVAAAVPRQVAAAAPAPVAVPASRLDGRTLRKTHRTVTFATKVTPEFDAEVRAIAQADGVLLVQVLEEAMKAYRAVRG